MALTPLAPDNWPWVPARLVRGHRVASGQNADPRFPGGTLAMQRPHFVRRGLDLSHFHGGTLNLQITPRRAIVKQPRVTFEHLRWHPVEPAETFSFFDAWVDHGLGAVKALVYLPHPETKPAHFQDDGVIEVLAPFVPGLRDGMTLLLAIDPQQMALD